jgi:hypothetical protein
VGTSGSGPGLLVCLQFQIEIHKTICANLTIKRTSGSAKRDFLVRKRGLPGTKPGDFQVHITRYIQEIKTQQDSALWKQWNCAKKMQYLD